MILRRLFRRHLRLDAAVIQEILKNYDKMVIVVDEKKGLVTVTTKNSAQDKGLKPFSFGP